MAALQAELQHISKEMDAEEHLTSALERRCYDEEEQCARQLGKCAQLKASIQSQQRAASRHQSKTVSTQPHTRFVSRRCVPHDARPPPRSGRIGHTCTRAEHTPTGSTKLLQLQLTLSEQLYEIAGSLAQLPAATAGGWMPGALQQRDQEVRVQLQSEMMGP